ncbi:hypothetical protein Hamer_G022073 [Homarus americanus]|uniref:Uncharacterized protein n=1 Tax=Homarus americanus TaxID=6706 RepID=A0A8J5N9Z6_HOMAM|nr:hypothetical protein Hamer_G022073 [Homarus americanus]
MARSSSSSSPDVVDPALRTVAWESQCGQNQENICLTAETEVTVRIEWVVLQGVKRDICLASSSLVESPGRCPRGQPQTKAQSPTKVLPPYLPVDEPRDSDTCETETDI